jgi:hypothetical protein
MRIDPADAEKILQRNYRPGSDLSAAVAAAESLVDGCVTAGLGEAQAKIVEAHLAAHFYAISERQLASKSALGVSASFDGNTDMYLEATLHGQQAMLLDTSGYLRTLNSGGMTVEAKPRIRWLGTKL